MTTWIEVGTLVAEFLIAVVIYYEIEENRAAAFLNEAHGETARRRAEIYDVFVDSEGSSLAEKQKSFNELLKHSKEDNGCLRDKCNEQLLMFAKFNHMLRFSAFHHRLMIQWFPQVLIRLWVMLGSYLEDMEQTGYWQREPLMKAVLKSIKRLKRSGCHSVAIYSRKTEARIEIDAERLKQMDREVHEQLLRYRQQKYWFDNCRFRPH